MLENRKTKLKSEGSKQTRSELHSALSQPNEMNSHIKVMERAVNEDNEIMKVEGFPYLHPEAFDFQKEIGKGTNVLVYRVLKKDTKELFAIKEIQKYQIIKNSDQT